MPATNKLCALCVLVSDHNRYTNPSIPVVAPPQVSGALTTMFHYGMSPLWTQQLQDPDTPGTSGGWPTPGGPPSPVWPGQEQLGVVFGKHLMTGQQINFTAVQEWFMPLYTAWQGNPSAVITLEQVLEFADRTGPGSPYMVSK